MNKTRRKRAAVVLYACILLGLFIFAGIGRITIPVRHDFIPFRAVYFLLADASPIYDSLKIWWFFLYIPFGYLFMRVCEKYHSGIYISCCAGLMTTVASILLLLIYEGQDWFCFDLDNVIASMMGAGMGCALHTIIHAIIMKRSTIQMDYDAHDTMPSINKVAVIYFCTVVSFLICFGCCNDIARQGIVRYSQRIIPKDIYICADAIETEQLGHTYSADEINLVALVEKLTSVFTDCIPSGNKSDSFSGDFYLDIENGFISARENGTWMYHQKDSPFFVTEQSDEAFEQLAREIITPFLHEDEYAVCISNKIDYFEKLWVTSGAVEKDKTKPYRELCFELRNANPQNVVYFRNTISFAFHSGNLTWIEYQPIRMQETEEIPLVSLKDAVQFGKRIAINGFERKATNLILTAVEPTYIYLLGKDILVPGYRITGTYTDRNGDTQEWETQIDAVDRRGAFVITLLVSLVFAALSSWLLITKIIHMHCNDEEPFSTNRQDVIIEGQPDEDKLMS